MVVAAVIVLPFTPLRGPWVSQALRPVVFAVIGGIIATYVLAAEVVKWLFYRAESRTGPGRGKLSDVGEVVTISARANDSLGIDASSASSPGLGEEDRQHPRA